jgi:enamine deaminase RidA (YjgF/YER057c/UK114 family)
MINLQEKLTELGHTLPKASSAVASYVPYVISGNQIFIAGQIPFINGEAMHQGIVGQDLTLEQAQQAAIACGLNILAQVNAAVQGDWSRIKRCVKMGGFVACTPDFTDHPKVINGASELMTAVMGDAGQHARFAVGAPCLPLNVAVEIDAIFELTEL